VLPLRLSSIFAAVLTLFAVQTAMGGLILRTAGASSCSGTANPVEPRFPCVQERPSALSHYATHSDAGMGNTGPLLLAGSPPSAALETPCDFPDLEFSRPMGSEAMLKLPFPPRSGIFHPPKLAILCG
jgi:hypothetical protein